VPLDLEKSSLKDGLLHSTLNLSAPIFISCLGVLAYLQIETIEGILRDIAAMAKGSFFVFAFAPRQQNNIGTQKEISSISERAAAHGEPWLTRFEPIKLKKLLIEHGFSAVSFLRPNEAKSRYYKARKDLPAPRAIRLCEALV
jgi:O-methyltransferase involved in polyketide biosynthesis